MFGLSLCRQEMGRRKGLMDIRHREGVSVFACHHTATLHHERERASHKELVTESVAHFTQGRLYGTCSLQGKKHSS